MQVTVELVEPVPGQEMEESVLPPPVVCTVPGPGIMPPCASAQTVSSAQHVSARKKLFISAHHAPVEGNGTWGY